MTLATGQVVQDRYRIVSLLGQGGMGAVYRAWDMRLKAPMALKEMIPQPGLDPRALAQLRAQFEQEAVILARLNHPHLVRVTDFFEEEGNTYLVMDFVEGESLADRIKREGSLPEAQVLKWSDQLLDALAHCHAQGIIHRDVKPQNVMIRPDGRAVLVDFGLVKLWDPRDPRTRTVMRGMGTPEYASPEQYGTQPGHTGPRSDLYSLGATLYHALTGQAPPTANDRMADPDYFLPPRRLNPQVSAPVETAVLRAMELPRGKRFQSAQEMVTVLRGGPSAPAGQKRIPAWAWAVLAIVAGVVIAMSVGRDGSTPAPPDRETATIAVPGDVEQKTATPSPSPSPRVTPSPPPSPTATATRWPTSAPIRTLTRTPTPTATATPRPTSTPVRTLTPMVTPTPRPSPTATPARPPTSTRGPTSTPTPVPPTTVLEPVAPAQGGEYKSPVTFQWRGSLSTGQAYQVTARHTESSYVIQSGLLTDQSWTTSLPADRFGEWRWTVSVVQGGTTVTTSPERMFWFNPQAGGDGDGGNGGQPPKNTPPP